MPQTSEVPKLDLGPKEPNKKPELHLVRDVREGSLAQLIGLEGASPPEGNITYEAEILPNREVRTELKVDVAGHADKSCQMRVKPVCKPSTEDNQVVRYFPPDNSRSDTLNKSSDAETVRHRVQELTEDLFNK